MISTPLVALLVSASPATPAATGPVRVDAEQVVYAFQRREVVFTGRKSPVTLTRDGATLTCARLVAKNDEGGQIATATCEGGVKLVRGDRTITCSAAVYENAGPRVTCTGDAVLRSGDAEGRGEKLVYDLRTDEVKLEGKDGAPVVITLPGDQIEQSRQHLERRRETRKGTRP